MRQDQKGFSLIELLVVVAIILIIAAIAIPNFMRARMSAHESSAAASLRTINTAEMSYATTYPTVGFTALASLGGAAVWQLGHPPHNGLEFSIGEPPAQFRPLHLSDGRLGDRLFGNR